MSLAIATAGPADRVAALQLLFQHFAPEEALQRIATALPLVQDSDRHRLNLLVARSGGIVGAMLAQALRGGTGLVWPPQTAPASALVEDELIDAALAWLRERGAMLAQALLAPDEAALAGPLRRNGFTQPTRLWYLRHDLDWPTELLQAPGPLNFLSYGNDTRDAFRETMRRTYIETQDFPELNGLRSLDEVLAGHQAEGASPQRWWLAIDGVEPVGVLILAAAEEPDELELAYLGVVPEARRRGWGRELVRKALAEATAAGMRALTLSIDARNEPAWKIYRRWRFEPYAAREVFLKAL